jgi:hypothetical protein
MVGNDVEDEKGSYQGWDEEGNLDQGGEEPFPRSALSEEQTHGKGEEDSADGAQHPHLEGEHYRVDGFPFPEGFPVGEGEPGNTGNAEQSETLSHCNEDGGPQKQHDESHSGKYHEVVDSGYIFFLIHCFLL